VVSLTQKHAVTLAKIKNIRLKSEFCAVLKIAKTQPKINALLCESRLVLVWHQCCRAIKSRVFWPRDLVRLVMFVLLSNVFTRSTSLARSNFHFFGASGWLKNSKNRPHISTFHFENDISLCVIRTLTAVCVNVSPIVLSCLPARYSLFYYYS